MENKYINHSGGCPGSDMMWEDEGYIYNVESIAYSFQGHKQESKTPKILNNEELLEGWEHVKIAEKSIGRPLFNIQSNPYVRNLLSRNWFQVKNADSIYAIGTFIDDKHKIVNGGTGWAVQMAIDNNKPVYVFEQNLNEWFIYHYPENEFKQIYSIPYLTQDFAGIGTRDLNINGEKAIKDLYQQNLK